MLLGHSGTKLQVPQIPSATSLPACELLLKVPLLLGSLSKCLVTHDSEDHSMQSDCIQKTDHSVLLDCPFFFPTDKSGLISAAYS